MKTYMLQLFLWTREGDGTERPQLQRQYRILATSRSVARDVASMLMGHEPLLEWESTDEVVDIGVNLEQIQRTS